MRRTMGCGCGCAAAVVLFVFAVPLLFLGVGTGTSASPAGAHAGEAQRVVPATGSSCNNAVQCQQRPGALPYVPSGFFPDAFTNPPGECTSWAAALWPGHRGRGVTWSGDAWEWYANAAAQGYAVDGAPTLGSIAVFARTGGAGEWGHVAIVIGVEASAVRISEMNVVDSFVVDERSLALTDPRLLGFIPVPADAFT